MPKLSAYLEQGRASETKAVHQEPRVGASRPIAEEKGHQAAGSQHRLPPKYAAAAAKLREDYEKRVRDHGPRTYRWPDGSLRPEKPAPNAHTAASRQKWAALVLHCRTHGGERSYERNGYSLRYGINVSHGDYVSYLGSIGLEPETDSQGQQLGMLVGVSANPLHAADHCFNTFYQEGAAAVFKNRRGRLL